MNHKFVPAVAAFLILGMLLAAIPVSVASVYAIGPQLGVVTIPQDDQALGTGVIILGLTPGVTVRYPGPAQPLYMKLMAQYKIIITYNGQTLLWQIGTAGPSVTCNILEKDKVQVIPDPKSQLGQQGSWETLMTKLVDVTDKFVCKPRWKSPVLGWDESVGVLDVYWDGPLPTAQTVVNGVPTGGVTFNSVGYWLADNIVTVEAYFSAGSTVVFGSDIQDLCTLGWGVPVAADNANAAKSMIVPPWFTLPDGTTKHYYWLRAMGLWVSCEALTIAERNALGIPIPTTQDTVV